MFNRTDLQDDSVFDDDFHKIAVEKEGLNDMMITLALSDLPDSHKDMMLDTIALLASRKLELEDARTALVTEIDAAVIAQQAEADPTLIV
jgi:hypothetical protein